MSYDGDDNRIEELLRETLHEEAEGVQPAGDGLSRIQQRIADRRARMRWLRPATSVAAAAALVLVGVGGYTLATRNNGRDTVKTITNPSPTSTPSSPSPTATTPLPPPAHFPAQAMFPFANAAAERQWEAGAAATYGDPQQTALSFATGFLQEPSLSLVTDTVLDPAGTSASVTLGRTIQGESSRKTNVTTVRLVKFRKAWLVVGADDAGGLLRVTKPAAGDTVSSPVTVAGPGFGQDEAVNVSVVSTQAGMLGSLGHASFGNGTPQWSTTVGFGASPDATVGVVVDDPSMADGLPGRITVVAVRVTSGAASYPTRFVGIKNGRVTLFASSNGAALSYLTSQQPGGGASDPQVEGATVYYLQGNGTCSNTLMSVPMSGGTPSQVATPDAGYAVAGYAVSADGTKTALNESACSGTPQGKLVTVAAGRTTTIATFPSFPPTAVGDPSWEPDGVHLDAFVRSGNGGAIQRYDTSAPGQTPTSRCNDAGAPPASFFEVDATGTLWFTNFTGAATEIRRCPVSASTAAVTIPTHQPADLDVAADGSAVLVTDINGNVWRWSPGGKPMKLSSVPLTQVSW